MVPSLSLTLQSFKYVAAGPFEPIVSFISSAAAQYGCIQGISGLQTGEISKLDFYRPPILLYLEVVLYLYGYAHIISI